ncbi:hypothetical protein OG455_25605 [Kitasatospora sp. NBC_01287]|uniref:hypothetical protein n=1 Tax=Kitasatospora sp. NBC_01287 TaxID=2903573 RepID=UPI002253386E|nr:hypothetical protein [Kitasatospora sp. NBC_01287]MCX4748850.1 hypothetical protein [Kitasatospora sp. NBC_01287]
MADGFEVDLGALKDAATGVDDTLAQVGQQSVTDIPHDAGKIGHGHLADVLSDFLSRWKRGVDNLAKDGKEVVDRLTASNNAYVKADQDAQQHIVTAANGDIQGSGPDPGVQ